MDTLPRDTRCGVFVSSYAFHSIKAELNLPGLRARCISIYNQIYNGLLLVRYYVSYRTFIIVSLKAYCIYNSVDQSIALATS